MILLEIGHSIYTSTVSVVQFINRLNCLYYHDWLNSIFQSMSKCQSNLRNFLKNLQSQTQFPRESIINFLPSASITSKEFQSIFCETQEEYGRNVELYRQMAILLFVGLSKNMQGVMQNAIQFVEGMILSRLMMLIFNEKGQLQIDQVLFYLEPTLQLAVLKGLQNSKQKLLFNLLVKVNSKERKFSHIGFLIQMLLIRKIQKYLDEISLSDFNEILKELLAPKKWLRLSSNQNSLHFRHIAILRQEEDRQECYYLQFLNQKKLLKMKQPLKNVLPNWVQQAFWTIPKELNLLDFRNNSVAKVFCLLCQVQVFASSPLIQQFDCYTRQQEFLCIFQQFLMGLNISREAYQFNWQKMRRYFDVIGRNLLSQQKCYIGSMIEELLRKARIQQAQMIGDKLS